jgi:hypothetical protein
MYTRGTLIKTAATGAVAATALGARALAEPGPAIAAGSDFIRSDQPPLRLRVPDGWSATEDWDPASVNPISLVALTNSGFDIGLREESSLPSAASLPADGIVLTIGGVPLADEPVYADSAADPGAFSAKDVGIGGDTGVDDVTAVNSWIVAKDKQWGYLIAGLIGPSASQGDRGKLVGVLNSVKFG